MRRPTATLFALAGGLLLASTAAAVNPPVPVAPKRYSRALLVGNLSFLDAIEPTLTAGGFYQLSLSPSRVELGPECGGLGCVTPPRLYGHALLTGGLTFDDEDYALFGQLGLVYRAQWSVFTSAGVAAQAAMPWRAVGPVLRLEVLDNVGLQGGWLFGDDGGVFVSVDYFHALFDDLGLK